MRILLLSRGRRWVEGWVLLLLRALMRGVQEDDRWIEGEVVFLDVEFVHKGSGLRDLFTYLQVSHAGTTIRLNYHILRSLL